eukprot:318365-Chlamydomonas_euryale.AAC.10
MLLAVEACCAAQPAQFASQIGMQPMAAPAPHASLLAKVDTSKSAAGENSFASRLPRQNAAAAGALLRSLYGDHASLRAIYLGGRPGGRRCGDAARGGREAARRCPSCQGAPACPLKPFLLRLLPTRSVLHDAPEVHPAQSPEKFMARVCAVAMKHGRACRRVERRDFARLRARPRAQDSPSHWH